MVVFAQHNLIKDPPFTNIDLVTCRNLLIYLQPVLQRKVLGFFNFSLRPGGLLMLGLSETIGEFADMFETLDSRNKLYRCKGKANAVIHADGSILTTSRRPMEISQRTLEGRQAHRISDEEHTLQRFVDSLSAIIYRCLLS